MTPKDAKRWLALLLAGCTLLWPALYNGEPLYHTDTSAYLRGADAGIQRVTGHSSAWSLPDNTSISDPSARPATASLSSVRGRTVLSGRSPYYGLMLYLGELAGGFWLTVAVQAAAILVSIILAMRAAGIPIWPVTPMAVVLLAAASSAPFYASMLMPDSFAAVLILGCSVLLTVRHALQRVDYIAWLVLVSAALIFHDSHLLIAISMLSLGVLWNLRGGWANWRGLVVVSTAIAVALAAQLAFDIGVTRLVGAPPLRPPFLIARLVSDGPGYRYLKATCPDNGFAICKFLDRLPMDTEQFLWSPDDGVFNNPDPGLRRRLSAEQTSFALAVFRFDPVGVILAATHDFIKEATMTGLEEFQYGDFANRIFDNKLPSSHLAALHRSAAYRGTMPVRTCAIVNALVVLGALICLVWLIARTALKSNTASAAVGVALWILVGIVANAAICGILSQPVIRYSSRVQWLIPFAAILLIADRLSRRVAIRASGVQVSRIRMPS